MGETYVFVEKQILVKGNAFAYVGLCPEFSLGFWKQEFKNPSLRKVGVKIEK